MQLSGHRARRVDAAAAVDAENAPTAACKRPDASRTASTRFIVSLYSENAPREAPLHYWRSITHEFCGGGTFYSRGGSYEQSIKGVRRHAPHCRHDFVGRVASSSALGPGVGQHC